jgi:hypothetical protein
LIVGTVLNDVFAALIEGSNTVIEGSNILIEVAGTGRCGVLTAAQGGPDTLRHTHT